MTEGRIKKLNQFLQTPGEGKYDPEKFEIISKITEFDQKVGVKLINAYFLSWYDNEDHDECQMGESDFLESFLTKSLSHNTELVSKIMDACFDEKRTESHRSIAMKLLEWSKEEERYNMLHFMPDHWYHPVDVDDLLSLFDGEDFIVQFIDNDFVPSTLSSDQLDELFSLVPKDLIK